MNVGMVCYPSVGGSGIVATELSVALAGRGHSVHIISTEPPFRLPEYRPGIAFHRVHAPGYPVLREPQYLLALSNKIVQVAREESLDIVHAHYAIPHAAAAYLARQILSEQCGRTAPRIVTTLHGTDITLLGSDRSYTETVAFCIDQSDGVTAVSHSLRDDTYRELRVRKTIEVIPNFLDCKIYRRRFDRGVRDRLAPPDEFDALVIHVSNFRAVKRVDRVVEIFARLRKRVRAKLVLVGDGPDFDKVADLIERLGLEHAVEILGEQQSLVPLLSVADLFLLPSSQESFGLAALEAMGCEVPVVASAVGGLPEVIDHGVTGFLHAPDDLDAMVESAARLLSDRAIHERFARAARQAVVERFSAERIVPRYEATYEHLARAASEPVPRRAC
jgi:N-acetyl-alpha-D-glucosaminyl L-malate synthase BshA